MNELEESWREILSSAVQNAEQTGRSDVADYLRLKLTNDQMRRAGVRWLHDTMIGIAAEANRRLTGLQIEREDPHNFEANGANNVGSLVRVRHGVRTLMVEAGWPRTPTDGFLRGGALAAARFTHFGIAKANSVYLLKQGEGVPKWHRQNAGPAFAEVTADELVEHFRIFLGDI